LRRCRPARPAHREESIREANSSSAVRNVAAFCDRIHAVDHVSDDGTWDILRRLAGELDYLDVHRSPRAGDSHRVLERYAGTPTWVLRVDGDELHDPEKLRRLREDLRFGAYADV